MIPYANLSGNSGIAGYEVGAAFIKVYFHNGDGYSYTHRSTGVRDVEHMKVLAASGRGLSTFIAQAVRDRYAHRFRWP